MTDPAPIPVSDDSYRPLSGLASLSGARRVRCSLFAALIVASLVVGIVKGTPIFFPIAIVLVAVLGFGLSYAGYRQILASEGTRVGVGIARLGMGLAVVTGLGYAAYSVSIGLAVAAQAEEFLAGEIGPDYGSLPSGLHQAGASRIQQAVKKAFLLTLQPSLRGNARLENEPAFRRQFDAAAGPEGQGHFTIFRNGMLVRMLSRGGQIESLGMRGWEHDKQSYKVARAYRLATPEGTLIVVLEAESAEGETEGQSRRWYVNYNFSGVESSTLTPLGDGVQKLRDQGRSFLQDAWLAALRAEKPEAREKKVEALDKSKWDDLVPNLPERMVDGKNAKREKLRTDFHAILGAQVGGVPNFAISVDTRNWPTWSHDAKGHLLLRQPFIANLGQPGTPPEQADGRIQLRTIVPMTTEDMASPALAPTWEVESIEIDRIKLR